MRPTESGAYTVQVTNSIATKLTLLSNTIVYNVVGGSASLQKKNKPSDDKVLSVYPNPATADVTIVCYITGKCDFAYQQFDR